MLLPQNVLRRLDHYEVHHRSTKGFTQIVLHWKSHVVTKSLLWGLFTWESTKAETPRVLKFHWIQVIREGRRFTQEPPQSLELRTQLKNWAKTHTADEFDEEVEEYFRARSN